MTPTRSRMSAALAFRYSAILAAIALTVTAYRMEVKPVFYSSWRLEVFRDCILGVEWFVILWVYTFIRFRSSDSAQIRDSSHTEVFARPNSISIFSSFGISIAIAAGLSMSAAFALDVSDSIFQSRLLPWIVPLIRIQIYGFKAASHMFPCQKEGFDIGCEWYKTLTAFMIANFLVYLPFAFVAVHAYRVSHQVKMFIEARLHQLVRWIAAFCILGLLLRILLCKLFPGVSSILAERNNARALWVALDNATGIMMLLVLATPLYIYRAFGDVRNRYVTTQYVVDFTWLASLYVCSLNLASVYP